MCRLTMLVAGAGYGKTTALRTWAATRRCCWCSLAPEHRDLRTLADALVAALRTRLPRLPGDIAAAAESAPDAADAAWAGAWVALLCEWLERRLKRDLVVVLDDVQELESAAPALALLGDLCRQAPRRLRLVLAGRREPPLRIDRMRLYGEVMELAAADLAFTVEEVAGLLSRVLGEHARRFAQPLHELTGGWPAAVRLAAEHLRTAGADELPTRFAGLRRGRLPLLTYLAGEVLDAEPGDARHLLSRAVRLERFTPALCVQLDSPSAPVLLESLHRRGLVERATGAPEWLAVTPVFRDVVRERWPLSREDEMTLWERAAAWFEGHGYPVEALRLLARTPDCALLAAFLARRGRQLLHSGALVQLLDAIESLPSAQLDAGLEQLAGEAHLVRGELDRALARFAHVAGDQPELDAALAWRLGMIHHLKGDPRVALAVYARGRVGEADAADRATLLAWRAAAHWLVGEAENCRAAAAASLAAASTARDASALAAAHTAMALAAALAGDRRANDAHYMHALEAAKRAGDALQIVRIRTNRSSLFMEEGRYREALAELASAIQQAEVAGYAYFHALALTNRGEVLLHLGRLDEAHADLELARSIFQRIGSGMVVYALETLGHVHRVRGELTLARSCYEEAVALTERSGDLQGLVPSLAGLARLLAREEPDTARALARRAVDAGQGLGSVAALIAAAWVALVGGDRATAVHLARSAEAPARARRDRPGMAEAVELQGLAGADAAAARERLEEAASAWARLGNPVGEARAKLWLADHVGGPAGRALDRAAHEQLQALGARGTLAFASGWLASLQGATAPRIALQTLGTFRVLRDGKPIARTEWQSRKARDLLKILVAREGRATPRELLMEALWPEEAPNKLGNRLSVALATVRTVLDPERRNAPDYFVIADRATVGLQLQNVRVDVLQFLEETSAALVLRARGETVQAVAALREAESMYAGDFLEEDTYEDWAVPLRERAREAYTAAARALAEEATAAGDHESAARFCLRLLERDAYDEPAHLLLVTALLRARRHGEARRRYRMYETQMQTIGVEPAPFPQGDGAPRAAVPAT